jgi:hypothetical protein
MERNKMKHVASALLLGAFAFVAIASTGSKKSEESEKKTSDPASAGETSAKAEETVRVQKIGEVVKFDDSEWVVIEAKDLGGTAPSNNQFEKAGKTEDGKFIRVKFSIKNNGKKEDMLFDQPKLVDSQGREFGHHEKEPFYVPDGAKTLGLEKLPVGLKKEYYSVYEVPKDAKGLKFQARALEVDGKKVDVDLGI